MNMASFYGARILVVGGAGFVGSNLVHQLLAHDPKEVIVVDNLLSSEVSNVAADARVRFILGSIAEDKILAHLPEDLQFVFHLACYHGNQSSIENPLADHDNNTLTSLKLFDRLKDFKQLQKVVYAAAACAVAEKTFDTPKATTEDQPIGLYHDRPYSISKIIGELYGNYYFQRYQLPFVKARFSNVYGPGEILGAGQWRGTVHTVWRNVIPTFIWCALHGESLTVDNGGNASRDFIFVEDVVRGLMICALKGVVSEVYNLATGTETSILNLAFLINQYTGNKTPLALHSVRDWDRSGKRFGSTDKAVVELGFRAEVDIQDGISRTIQWTRESFELIGRNIDKHKKLMTQAGV